MTLIAAPFIALLIAAGLFLLTSEHYTSRLSGAALLCFVTWGLGA